MTKARKEPALYAVALLRVASLVGLRQADIATHLGVTRMLVNHWASGKLPVTAKRVPILVARIAMALEHTLAHDPQTKARAELAAALNDAFTENLAAYKLEVSASMRELLADLTAAAGALKPPGAWRQRPALTRAKRLAATVEVAADVRFALLPLIDLLGAAALPFLARPGALAETTPLAAPAATRQGETLGG